MKRLALLLFVNLLSSVSLAASPDVELAKRSILQWQSDVTTYSAASIERTRTDNGVETEKEKLTIHKSPAFYHCISELISFPRIDKFAKYLVISYNDKYFYEITSNDNKSWKATQVDF